MIQAWLLGVSLLKPFAVPGRPIAVTIKYSTRSSLIAYGPVEKSTCPCCHVVKGVTNEQGSFVEDTHTHVLSNVCQVSPYTLMVVVHRSGCLAFWLTAFWHACSSC